MSDDIGYIEGVFEFLKEKENKINYIIIFQQLEIRPIIKEIVNIKHKYMNVEIIFIYVEIDEVQKNFLKNNGIIKLISEKELNIVELKKLMNENKVIKYVDNKIIKINYENQFLNKIVAIYGTEKSGKTTFTVNFAKRLSKKINGKILIMDIDILDSDIDKILKIDSNCNLMNISNEISKKVFNDKIIEKNIFKYDSKIEILLGNTSIYNCQNVLNVSIYEKIINILKCKYETIIIDTNSNIFIDSTRWALEKSDIIFYLFESKINEPLKVNKYIEFFISNWSLPQEKFKFVLTKCNLNSKNIISSIFDKKIEGYLSFNNNYIVTENMDCSLREISEYDKIIFKDNFSYYEKLFEKLKNLMKGIKNDN